jgi:hypothetical protein
MKLMLHRLECYVEPDKHASKALLRACGFRMEGIARGFLRIRNRRRDHERWAHQRGPALMRNRKGLWVWRAGVKTFAAMDPSEDLNASE